MAGLFITFEGIDYCGKTTQARKLTSYLKMKNHSILLIREPGGDRISEKIRKILLSEKNAGVTPMAELLLYEASRAQLTQKVVLPALKQGKIVVCDRYYDSTLAYQSYGRGLNNKIIRWLNQIATFGLTPDLTILIDVPVEVTRERRETVRRKADRLEKENIEFHRKIRQGYLKIARQNPKRIKIVDGTGDIGQTWQKVRKVVDSYLGKSHRLTIK
jgi:dTMP kinase